MENLEHTTESLIQALGRLAENAGFNRMVGQIYALLYLSPGQLSLGEIAEKLGVSKGSVSLNTTSMERWGMIKRFNHPADRRDYYEADTDFWRVIRGIMRTREKKIMKEFRNSLAESLKEVKKYGGGETGQFYEERLKRMLGFTSMFIRMLNAYIALEKFNFTGRKPPLVEGEDNENQDNEYAIG